VGGAKSPGDDRECNLSEDRCLEATDAREQDVKHGDAFNMRPGNEENPGQDGSARHNGPAVTPVDGAADRIGRETGKQEPDRGCAVKVGLGPAKVPSHGFGDQGKAVVDRSGPHAGGANLFFWTPGAMNGSTKVQSSQANRGCMLFGARRVHPVVVGWSTANRPLLPKPINDNR